MHRWDVHEHLGVRFIQFEQRYVRENADGAAEFIDEWIRKDGGSLDAPCLLGQGAAGLFLFGGCRMAGSWRRRQRLVGDAGKAIKRLGDLPIELAHGLLALLPALMALPQDKEIFLPIIPNQSRLDFGPGTAAA